MQKVIIIKEESEGIIGVAASYHDAIDYLMENKWIKSDTYAWERETQKWKTLKEMGLWNEHIYEMPEQFWEYHLYDYNFSFSWYDFYGTLSKENTNEVW